MKIGIDSVSIRCSGTKVPSAGKRYRDQYGTEWFLHGEPKRKIVLSSEPVWSFEIGTMYPKGPIEYGLELTRYPTPEDIRNARQQLYDMGLHSLVDIKQDESDFGIETLVVDSEEVHRLDIDLPDEIDEIKVIAIQNDQVS